MRLRSPASLLLLTSLAALSACRDSEIRTYRIPKETKQVATPAALAAAQSSATTPTLEWDKPANWDEQPGNTVRVGSFAITGSDGRTADMSVTSFPGDVGGDFANVNRWRGQIQLPPLAQNELEGVITSLDLPAGRFQLVNLLSEAPLIENKYHVRILGAWLKQPERTWFFKMAGESDLVASQRETFLTFLRSVKFAAPASVPADTNSLPDSSASMPDLDPHAGHDHGEHDHAGHNHAEHAPSENGQSSGLAWTAPTDWTAKPLGQMRRGSFAIRGGGGEADLSITVLGAATNPLLENINRWRGQLGLAPIDRAQLPAETTELVNGDLTFTLVEFSGKPPASETPTRLLGAILYRGPEAWFFKMTGPDALVAAQKPAFVEFLKTVKTR